MSWPGNFAKICLRWIEQVAATLLALRENLRPKPFFKFIEQDQGGFLLQQAESSANGGKRGARTAAITPPEWASELLRIGESPSDLSFFAKAAEDLRGAKIELVLRSNRFLFRQLELPRRASEFLDGIIRAQIDRLTPWSLSDAAFGWRPSGEVEGERLIVAIAATARTLIEPFTRALAAIGAGAVIISAPAQEAGRRCEIAILEQKFEDQRQANWLRRILLGALIASAVFCFGSIAASIVIGGQMETQRDLLIHANAERAAALRRARGAMADASLPLQQRKNVSPSSVIVVEALSRILPDDTYLTELRMAGESLQIIGVTSDAASLVRIIEQSPHFRGATFFAPTTKSSSETNEHFSIETKIKPDSPTSE